MNSKPVFPSRYAILKSSVLLFILSTALTSPVWAQSSYWRGTASSDWLDERNWTNGLPNSGVDGKVGQLSARDPILTGQASVHNLEVGWTINETTLTISSGGSLTVAGDYAWVGGGRLPTALILTDARSALNAPNAQLIVGHYVMGGISTLDVSGGAQLTSLSGIIGKAAIVSKASVRGKGSSWIMTGDLTVGNSSYGGSSLTISGGGLVQNANGHIGSSSGPHGVVTVTGAGSSWVNTGDLYVDGGTLGNGTRGTLVIADGGSVTSKQAYIAYYLNSNGEVTVSGEESEWLVSGDIHLSSHGAKGVLNIGAAADAQAAGAGYVEAMSLIFGNSNDRLVFNHTSSDYEFEIPLLGAGTITQLAGTTILSADNGAFSGATNITGGNLQVDERLGGITSVGADLANKAYGVVSGTGSLAALYANAFGTVAPGETGSSIGTLSVYGPANFASRSILQMDVNAGGQSDRLDISGALSIEPGAFLAVKPWNGSYRTVSNYTLITAAGGISGDFFVNNDLFFLTPTLSKSGNSIFLKLERNANQLSAIADTSIEAAAAEVIDQLAGFSLLYDAFMPLSQSEAADLIGQVSGQDMATGQSLVASTFEMLSGGVMDHLARTSGGPKTGAGSSALSYSEVVAAYPALDAVGAMAAMPASVRSVWIAPVAALGSVGSNNSGSVTVASGGLAGGIDYAARLHGADIVGGAALGYLKTSANGSRIAVDADMGQISLYGSWTDGPVSISGIVGGALDLSTTRRRITAAGLDLTAASSALTQTLGASLEAAYAFDLEGGLVFSPKALLNASISHRGPSTETGAGIFNLDIDAAVWSRLEPGLGLELSQEIATDYGTLTATLGTAWLHSLGDTQSQRVRFEGTNLDFEVAENSADRDRFMLDLSGQLATANGLDLFAGYSVTASAHSQQHAVRAGLKQAF